MNGWTKECHTRQAELIRNWHPSAKSTGPKSDRGKERVAPAMPGAVVTGISCASCRAWSTRRYSLADRPLPSSSPSAKGKRKASFC